MKVRVNKSSAGGLPLLTGTSMRRMWVAAAASVVLSATTKFNAGCALFIVHAFATDRSAVLSNRPQTLIRRSTELSAASKNDVDFIVGGPSDKVFTPILVDGAKFNLFRIGRQDDEDKNGAFQLPPNSMNGKIVLITGASAGLGLESAKRLALAGATVILTARTQEKVIASANAVREYCKGGTPSYGKTGRPVIGAYINPNSDIRGIDLDLDDLSSVRSFPERYLGCMQDARVDVDLLMNNAGGSKPSRVLTVDGYSSTLQSCHLGHFLLTARLLEEGLLNRDISGSNNGCTVINLTSCSYRSAIANHGKYKDDSDIDYGFDFDNMNGEIEYEAFGAYFSAKLANVLFTKELQRRAEEHEQSWLKAVSVEPGGVGSDIWRYDFYDPRSVRERCDNGEELVRPEAGLSKRLVAQFFYRVLMAQVERGANSQIWLALQSGKKSRDDEDAVIRGGQHFDENRNAIPVTAFADNEDTARKLWELSEEMCGVKFDLSAL